MEGGGGGEEGNLSIFIGKGRGGVKIETKYFLCTFLDTTSIMG